MNLVSFMFKPLGLFANSPCPDISCHRPRCLFAHSKELKPFSTHEPFAGPSVVRRKSSLPISPVKRTFEPSAPFVNDVEKSAGVKEPVTKRAKADALPHRPTIVARQETVPPGMGPTVSAARRGHADQPAKTAGSPNDNKWQTPVYPYECQEFASAVG